MTGRVFFERHLIGWWGKNPMRFDNNWRFECVIRPRRELTAEGFLLAGFHIEFWMNWIDFGLRLFRVPPTRHPEIQSEIDRLNGGLQL